MRTALDSNVILDVVVGDSRFAGRSEAAIRSASTSGSLIVGECVVAEIRPAFTSGDMEQFLVDWNIAFEPSSLESSLLAGEMLAAYLRRRGSGRARVVADFLIGAPPSLHADRLLARDRGYFRDYFKSLIVLEP